VLNLKSLLRNHFCFLIFLLGLLFSFGAFFFPYYFSFKSELLLLVLLPKLKSIFWNVLYIFKVQFIDDLVFLFLSTFSEGS